MANGTFTKVGSEGRNDHIVKETKGRYLVVFGYTEADGYGYSWRKRYDHKPTVSELKAETGELVNAETDRKIKEGFKWDGKAVWLSQENQFNYKAAYDLAVQTEGKNLPVTFKFGTEENPQYQTFEGMDSLEDFYTKAIAHIQSCLAAGWAEKDGTDWEVLLKAADEA